MGLDSKLTCYSIPGRRRLNAQPGTLLANISRGGLGLSILGTIALVGSDKDVSMTISGQEFSLQVTKPRASNTSQPYQWQFSQEALQLSIFG